MKQEHSVVRLGISALHGGEDVKSHCFACPYRHAMDGWRSK